MNMMKKGEMSYLLADGSRIIKQETYNAQSDKYNRKNYYSQKPVQSVGDNKRVENEEYEMCTQTTVKKEPK